MTRDRSIGSCPHLLEQGHSMTDCHSSGCVALRAAAVLRQQQSPAAPTVPASPPADDAVGRALDSHVADRHMRSWERNDDFGTPRWNVLMLDGERLTLYSPREAQLFCYGMCTAAQAYRERD